MLARWALPAIRRQARLTLVKRTCYHTESFNMGEPGVTKMEVYGDNGHFRFDMDIYNYLEQDNDSPILIYLPAISFELTQARLKDPDQVNFVPEGIPPNLGRSLRVVRINYRWSRSLQWPRPFHDVIFGYDAIVRNFCSPTTKVGLYGRYLGGTLAASLALTESRPAKIGYISTLAISDSPLDFTSLATDDISPENFPYLCHIEDEKARVSAVQHLLSTSRTMRMLFSSPAACFDPFASPILFFRNSGREAIPEDFAYSYISRDSSPIAHISAYPNLQNKQKGVRTPPIRFPPKDSGLKIPKTLIYTTEERFADHQGQELVKLMKRSIIFYEMKENRDADVDAKEEAENRVQYVNDPDPIGMTKGFRKENRAKEGRIIAWLEDVLHN